MYRQFIESTGRPVLVSDTITILEPGDAGAIIVSGSHGGLSSAQFVLGRDLTAVFYNDAGIGKDEAGIAGLHILDGLGLPAIAVDHMSAAIGDGRDTWAHGLISRANVAAVRAGVRPGQSVRDAAGALSSAPVIRTEGARATLRRDRHRRDGIDLVLLDSISMAAAEDAGAIVVTGSHGGAVSAEFAKRHPALLVVFNDAGIGKDGAGCAALDILAEAGHAALTIDCRSGRIGDPADMLDFGVISVANAPAGALGIQAGATLRPQVQMLCRGGAKAVAGGSR